MAGGDDRRRKGPKDDLSFISGKLHRATDPFAGSGAFMIMARKSAKSAPLQEAFDALDLVPNAAELTPHQRRAWLKRLDALSEAVAKARPGLDPIRDPGASFDPRDPITAGRIVAMALLAQERVPLANIAPTYGSGIYAIYFIGAHPAYAPLRGTETPLYVGKADPARGLPGRTPREQGPALFGRLKDHRRMIATVEGFAAANSLVHPIRVADFECRRLVCPSGMQLAAEDHLIGLFRPVWNKQIGIAWGISKHGDTAETRGHPQAPWDVLHAGRAWAVRSAIRDGMTPATITAEIAAHVATHPPFLNRGAAMEALLASFAQAAAATAEESAAAEDAEGVAEAAASGEE